MVVDRHDNQDRKGLPAPWHQPAEALAQALETSLTRGIDPATIRRRRKRHGRNRIRQKSRRKAGTIFIAQFKSLIPVLLVAAVAASLAFSQWMEATAIAVALLINVFIGFFTELKATRSMEGLRKLSQSASRVIRDEREQEVSSSELLPGDLVVLEPGDVITADIRLIETRQLQINESALTGESDPAEKSDELLEEDTGLADRTNMAFKGTFVVRGSAKGLVVATGMESELGRIAALAQKAEPAMTPLEGRLNALGQRLIWAVLAIAAAVTVSGLLAKQEPALILKTAVALAIAAIPEGLPIVATVALARGMWHMARRNAIVNRLSSVETLGSTTTICTDKTGTLTENRMKVTELICAEDQGPGFTTVTIVDQDEGGRMLAGEQVVDVNDHPLLRRAIEVALLCNNAQLNGEEERGVPEEIALRHLARISGMRTDQIAEAYPRMDEDPFDSRKKRMATFHRSQEGVRVAVKGAPEVILEACSHFMTRDGEAVTMNDEQRQRWIDCMESRAAEGLRMLALAEATVGERDDFRDDDLTLLAWVGFEDPPRPGIVEEIATLQRAGLRIVMVTGDQRRTAMSIAKQLGLVDDASAEADGTVFARTSPEEKLELVTRLQEEGAIVAMTGDGVNDAPALEKADIGVAMGRRGTQVAREAADIVLRDDAFQTISVAVEQGRIIFNNIRKFVVYLLSGNVGEIMIVTFALLAGWPLPLLPLQILYLNMISDVFPALALGLGYHQPQVMTVPPRPSSEAIITRSHWYAILAYGLLICLPTLLGFLIARRGDGADGSYAVTVSFLTLALARTWHVFNMRGSVSGMWVNEVTRNVYVWGAVGISLTLLVAAPYVAPLATILGIRPPGMAGWSLILPLSLVPLAVAQGWRAWRARQAA